MKTTHIPAFLLVLFAAFLLLAPQSAMCAEEKAAQPAMKAGALSGPVNINTATAEELAKLPGIGPKIAEEIVNYRKEHGAFKTPRDIVNVKGIGDKKYEAIQDKITVGTP